jgi:hypothetical protein
MLTLPITGVSPPICVITARARVVVSTLVGVVTARTAILEAGFVERRMLVLQLLLDDVFCVDEGKVLDGASIARASGARPSTESRGSESSRPPESSLTFVWLRQWANGGLR